MRECVAPFHAGAVSSLGTVLSGVGRRVNKLGLGSGQGQGWLPPGVPKETFKLSNFQTVQTFKLSKFESLKV